MNTRRSAWLLALLILLLLTSATQADAWDPPSNYYNAATSTGATLKNQLTSIMSTGHILRSYGDYRFAAAITDADPDNSGNILLAYTRASVPATWDAGATWNREHVWPQSLQPGSVSNSTTGRLADPHSLRPVNPSVNGSRGNKPFGLDNTTGSNGAVSGGYYYPGDADKGDIARQLFYHDTRWGSSAGLSLVDGLPGTNQMSDLSSLIAWHFLDVPDDFERHRNQAIYSAALNPFYYTNNRNAFIDHPEFVWSVYVDQSNDSQITIVGGATDGNGGSVRDVDLGRVFVGSAVPAAQTFTLDKSGLDGTYFEVGTSGDAVSSVTGRYNAFRTNATDSRVISVGLNTSTATAGLKSGTVMVDNLDITSESGSGHGAHDGDDLFNVDLAVIDHAKPSFDNSSEAPSLVYDFGSVSQGSPFLTFSFDVHNVESTLGYTADLDFDNFLGTGDLGAFPTDFASFAGSLSLAAGSSQSLHVSLDTVSPGIFSVTYALSFSDEDLPGALTSGLSLTVLGNVVAVPEPSTWILCLVALGVLSIRRQRVRTGSLRTYTVKMK